ncbi:MAG: tetratricopeptide repeat protein [Bacteroidetes bacterium]|nr:tetratricopeptide repeat protein [Bacteroidota bacterium]
MRKHILFLICLTAGFLGFAQKTQFYLDKEALYKSGLELFDKKQYTASEKAFIDYMATIQGNTLLKTDAEFYAAACAVELFHKDGEWRMREFIEHHPESNKIKTAYFYLGKSNFRKKKYDETIKYLEKVDIYELSKEDLAELYFKRGYSYFETSNFEKAKTDFYEIKDVDNKYAHPANYYYSHIAYHEKNYEIALQGFNRLLNNETFGPVVPYYITQIYFIQGKYEEVIKNAPALLNDSNHIQKAGEINRMIGESYFHTKDYGNALTYLKRSESSAGLNVQGNYQLGYCYYQIKDYTNAMAHLEKTVDAKDSLAQNAWYHLADCYIQANDKNKARNAYYAAYNMDFDPMIKEDALFSYAKLCYELSFAPYNDAVNAFNTYIKNYPASARKDEAYKYLINVYSTTKNYKEAIASIEKLHPQEPQLKTVYQKLIYFRGVEFFNNNVPDSAEAYFKKSLRINFDKTYNALSLYWLGEISYQRKDYSTAIETWKSFQINEGAFSLKEYDLSNYNIGYAYFQQKGKDNFANANIAFRKFLLTKQTYDVHKIADANVRTADCYFMTGDYAQAADRYETAIALNKVDVDYCMYQKALCSGLVKNYKEKINDLKAIETKYPKSNYLASSIYEIAETYSQNTNEPGNAIEYYERILKEYPNSSFVNSALANIGQIYYNQNQDEKAFTYFDKLVKKDKNSPEAKETALPDIRKIFEEAGKIDEMEAYFKALGNPLASNEIESSLYEAARKAYYDEKNFDAAMSKFESYITKYPDGKYILEAQYCYGECTYSKAMFDKALAAYQYVIGKPRNLYSEASLIKACYILYKDKKYEDALPLYQQLQEYAETPANKLTGRLGAMRCAFNLNRYETALTESNGVLTTEKISPQQTNEAKYDKARSLFELQRYDDALIEFKAMAKTSRNLTGAEALYYIARIYYVKQDYKEVEKTINSLVSYDYSNDDWNTKGLLLLADSYMARGDDADAELMLQTILDSKPKQEYVDEVNTRMEKIKSKKAARLMQEQQNNQMNVEFKSSNGDKDLFDQLYEQRQDSLKKEQTIQPNEPK